MANLYDDTFYTHTICAVAASSNHQNTDFMTSNDVQYNLKTNLTAQKFENIQMNV